MKIVINNCYGGFGLSDKALDYYNSLAGTNLTSCYNIERNDLNLIKTIEDFGKEANGRFAKLRIVEIPDNVNWEISEYDGMESIEEVHRSWS